MAWKRIVPFVLLGACLLLVIYTAIDPTKVVGGSNCDCSWPDEEMPTAKGPFPGDGTITWFEMYLYSYTGESFQTLPARLVQESTPIVSQDSDSCYTTTANAGHNSGFDLDEVQDSTWSVGALQYGAIIYATGQGNNWGYDGVGYGGHWVNYYREWAPTLPCGTSVPQNMAMWCPDIGQWATYAHNNLTATIDSLNTVTNCHEDMEGDYTSCETEND